MKDKTILTTLLLCQAALAVMGCNAHNRRLARARDQFTAVENFQWPNDRRAAVSLTFDDARHSQADNGFDILDKYNIKATFYVNAWGVEERLGAWRRAVRNGHEIGNHTVRHPCSGNFGFARNNALEDYTLEKIAEELDDASTQIENLLGIRPATYAYTCAQTFVGRGRNTRSYVPLVAERFVVGRGCRSETANDPAFCDLAQVAAFDVDGMDFERARALIDKAARNNRWIIFAGHEIGPGTGRQRTSSDTLEAICKYAADPENKLWIDTVENVGSYILKQRSAE